MLSKKELAKIQKEAIKAAHNSGEILLKYWRKKFSVSEKFRAGLVTEADLKSESQIRKTLQKAFPGFAFLGEEGGASHSLDSDIPMWHVDPLDGTTNFVHGFPMFCVSIGLAVGNQPLVGVVHIPSLNETIYAAEGQGCFFNKKRIMVSERKAMKDALLTTGFAYLDEEKALARELEKFKRVSLAARAVRRPGAAAIDLAYVAAGIFDGFWEKNLSSWDVCAGAVLVKEANGMLSDFSGKQMLLHKKEIVATNGHIHRNILNLLKD